MKKLANRNLYIIFVWVLFPVSSYSQSKNITTQNLAWFRYFNKLVLSETWLLNTQVEDRVYIFPWKQHQLLARTQVVYKVTSAVSVSQGFAYFLQSPHDPHSTSNFTVPELRPYQEIILKNDLGKKTKLSHRYKLEERFFRNKDAEQEKLLPGYNFYFRARYQVKLQYSLFNIRENPLKLVLSDELMVNFGKQIVHNSFDQNRFTIGLAYDFTKTFEGEIDYVNWFQQRQSGIDFYQRHIIRFTLYHSIDLRKKNKEA